MEYALFLDETGDHGLSYIDQNFPLFLLCGCVVSSKILSAFEKQVNAFKLKYFNTTEVILHSRDIRKCEGAFQILFNQDIKKQFYDDLNYMLSRAEYFLIGSAVQKERHIKQYGKWASNPYTLSLSFIVERVVFLLDSLGADNTIHILAEKRGRKEDTQLLSHFNSVLDSGTYYVSSERLRKTIGSFRFHHKRENIIGLQIADLCAYPLARHVLNPKEPYIPYKVIENKLYTDSRTGKKTGWGLKVFP
jgi:hypothetical protein